MLGLWINNSLTTNAKRKVMAVNSEYTFNTHDDGDTMFFVIVNMVQTDTHTGCSSIKSKLEDMKTSHFKNDIPKANPNISEWMNEI